MDHRLINSRIEVHRADAASARLAPFHPATLPLETQDVASFAVPHGLSEDAAAFQIERLRGRTIYMNDSYQVNVDLVLAPFGAETGDMFWLSIKRRDRELVHDWREPQQIKNMIVGDEHEGFEVYPAESRLVDTANQYHLVGVHGPDRAAARGLSEPGGAGFKRRCGRWRSAARLRRGAYLDLNRDRRSHRREDLDSISDDPISASWVSRRRNGPAAK